MLMIDLYLLAAGALLVVTGVWVWLQSRRSVSAPSDEDREVSAEALFESHPLVSETSLSLYNLMKLAVQDRYLVFVQVPIWSFVRAQAEDPSKRARWLRRLALCRADYVLVHPGTRRVETVVLLGRPEGLSDNRHRRDQLIGTVMRKAGIEVVRLDPGGSHSVSRLRTLLRLGPSEDDLDGL